MADQPAKQNNSDEIDLGQLFQMIGRGFNKIGIAFLRLFLYVKKRAFILGGLIVLGIGIGYGLNQIVEKKMKIEVIVKPNLDSENYLYDVVNEIQSNIRTKDTFFFKSIGAPIEELSQYKVSVTPIEQKKNIKGDLEYLQLLEKFRNDEQFQDIVRKELLKSSVLNHRIIFSFRDPSKGPLFSEKVMAYINSAEYYKELILTSNRNAKNRIELNELLIDQIDELIQKYTSGLDQKTNQNLDGRILLDNEEPMDLTGLLRLKNSLIENTQRKEIELREQTQAINVINFGRTQSMEKSFFGQKLVLLPTVFLFLFFTFEIISYLNRKSSELL
ncbi:hypothetical protein [Flagellimonas allohymeniacidonis]|uniref:Uncharacterized protein n=1 Tax=Flagellimonas allohymeniacidonis TaxID=2517819 RepID=A0A4Q8QDE1_9FLAO|nr:hypothetical protein [Allomuricauda hymeniacidonis]TAI47547.1 hypothetical protein EW142_12830 [Allomuricauda hymeniacidonis]